MRASLLPFVLLAALPSWIHLPAWAERWLYNPRERTATALSDVARGQPEAGVPALDTAARIGGENPTVQYNAGSGHLLANQPKEAVPYLEKAAEKATESGAPGLRSRTQYNLGNARLVAGDASGAVEAYKSALRLEPEDQDAKYNLELALRQLEQERQAKKPQETPQGGRQGEQERSDKGSGAQDQANEKRDPSSAKDPGQNEYQPPQQGGQKPQEKGLGNFQNQPDMTAQQAAALLESVENLERQQRKAEVARRVRRSPKGLKDW